MGLLKMVAIPLGITVGIPVVSIGLMNFNVEKYMDSEGIYDAYLLSETEGIDPKGEMYSGIFTSFDAVLDGEADSLDGVIEEKYLNTLIYEETIKGALGGDYANGNKYVSLSDGVRLYGYWVEFDNNVVSLNLGIGADVPALGEFQTKVSLQLKIEDNTTDGYYELALKEIKIGRLGLPGSVAGNIINLITEQAGAGSFDDMVNEAVGSIGNFDSEDMSFKISKASLVNVGSDQNAAMGEMVNILFNEGLITLAVREEEIALNIDTEKILITDEDEEFIDFSSVDLDGDGTVANNTDLSVTALAGYDVAAQGEKTATKFMLNQLSGLDYVDITEVELNNMVNGSLNSVRENSVMSINNGTEAVDYYFGAGGVVIDLSETGNELIAKTVISIGKLGAKDEDGNYTEEAKMAQIQIKAEATVTTNTDGDLEIAIQEGGLGIVAPEGVEGISVNENLIGSFLGSNDLLSAEENVIKVTLSALTTSMFGDSEDAPGINSISVESGKFRLGLDIPENEAIDNATSQVTDNITTMDEETKTEIFGDNTEAQEVYENFADVIANDELATMTDEEVETMIDEVYEAISGLDQESQNKLAEEMLQGIDPDDLAALFGL